MTCDLLFGCISWFLIGVTNILKTDLIQILKTMNFVPYFLLCQRKCKNDIESLEWNVRLLALKLQSSYNHHHIQSRACKECSVWSHTVFYQFYIKRIVAVKQ